MRPPHGSASVTPTNRVPIIDHPSAQLFPAGAVTAFADGTETPPPLPADEAAAVANAVETRRREFALGRWCARTALARLGVGPRSLLVGNDRAPIWPESVVGSITHCKGFVGAVVAFVRCLSAIGFDAETAEPLRPELVPMICTAREREWANRQRFAQTVDWPKLIFSAKEAVHKSTAPRSGVMLDFLDVELDFDPERSTFEARPAAPGSALGVNLSAVRGRFEVTAGFVYTCAFIPAAGAVE